MPGSCEFSADTNLKWYQKIANSLQVNNRAAYDKAVRDGWYGLGEWVMLRLRSWLGQQWGKILADFEKAATELFTRPSVDRNALQKYLNYYHRSDDFWNVLDIFKQKMGTDAAFNTKMMEDIIKDTVIDSDAAKSLSLNINDLRTAILEKVTRGNFVNFLENAPPENVMAINRFMDYMRDQNTLDSFMHYLDAASNKQLFITKAMTHVNYFGFLDTIYKTWEEPAIKAALQGMGKNKTPNDIVEYFVDTQVQKSFANLPATEQAKLRDVFLLKDADKQLQHGMLMNFLKASVRETRIISTMTKFSPFSAGSMLLTAQNLFTNILQFRWVKSGMPEYFYKHPLIDHVINTGLLDGMVNYENARALLMGSGKKTLAETVYEKVINKPMYVIANLVPTDKGKAAAKKLVDVTHDAVLTGAHNIQDHIVAPYHIRLGLTQAAFEIFGDHFDEALSLLQKNEMPKALYEKYIVRAKELSESGNNAFTSDVLRKHVLSTGPLTAVWYLQGYHIQRLWELTSSLKKFSDAFAKWEITDFHSFRVHLWDTNPELRKVLGVTLDTLHTAFYIDHYYDKEENNSATDYAALFHEYVSSFWASFFGRMFTNVLASNNATEAYEDATGKQVPMINGISLAALNFIDSLPSLMLREFDVYKIVPRMINALNADPKLFVTLRKEALDQMFNGNSRFNMPEGVNTLGQVSIAETDDIIGSLLLWMRRTNESIKMSDRLYNAGKVDAFINGKDEDDQEDGWLMRTMKALPILDVLFPADISTSAKWRGIQALKTTDPIFKEFYDGWDNVWGKYIQQFATDPVQYKAQVKDFFNDLTAFNYANWKKTDVSNLLKEDFYTSDKFDMKAKEELFTALLEKKLGKDVLDQMKSQAQKAFGKPTAADELAIGTEILTDKMFNTRTKTIEEAGFQKLLAEADAQVPGSSRVVISYLANQEFYEWAKEFGPRGMNGYVDMTQIDGDSASANKKALILQKYHPYMAIADKPSYMKVLSNQLKTQYPKVFSELGTSQRTMVNALSLIDYVAHTQAISGTPNAGLIANVLSVAGKYFKNDVDRLAVIKHTADSINQLDISQEDKNMALTGLFVGNTETLHKLAKDPVAMEQHGSTINWVIDLLYGVVDDYKLNGKNVHAMLESDFADSKQKAYYKQFTSRPYVQRPYNTTNARMQEKLADGAEKGGITNARSLYQPRSFEPQTNFDRNPAYFTASHAQTYAIARPQILDTYFKLSRTGDASALTSKELVKQTVKRSPLGEKNEYNKPRETTYVKKIFPAKPSVKWMRAPRIKKRGPHTDLPGGLPNVG